MGTQEELLVDSEWTWGDGRIHLRYEGHLVAKWGESLLDGAGIWEVNQPDIKFETAKRESRWPGVCRIPPHSHSICFYD